MTKVTADGIMVTYKSIPSLDWSVDVNGTIWFLSLKQFIQIYKKSDCVNAPNKVWKSHDLKKKKGSDEPWVETLLSRKFAWQRLPQWKFEHFVLLLNLVKHNFVQLCSSWEQMTDEVQFIYFFPAGFHTAA